MAVSKSVAKRAGFGCPEDLREYISALERAGELRRVTTEVDWQFEAGAMSRLVCERRGPAPLFENIKGYPGQALAGVLLGPSRLALHARTAIALGLDPRTPTLDLIEIIRQRLKAPKAPVLVSKQQAACKEAILTGSKANLLSFPVPWIKEIDGGRYLGTWDIVVTKDPDTGWVNWGMYRCMLKDEKHFAILLLPSAQHGGAIYKKFEERRKPMPIALVIGADPVSHLGAIARLDFGVSEVEATGGLRGEGVRLTKCETSDLEVPATAEMVIEAEVLPGERVDEGPFGEYTGHSAHRGKSPVARVTRITHRRNPIHTMANMGKPWDDAAACQYVFMPAVAKNRLEAHGIEVAAIYYYVPATAVIAIKPAPGLKQRIIATLLAGERLLPNGIVFVDEDVDVTNPEDVWWAVCSRMNPENYEAIKGVPAFPLNPWLAPEERERHEQSLGIMDATFPYTWSKEYREDHTKVSDFKHGWSDSTKQKILARWKEYGYGDI